MAVINNFNEDWGNNHSGQEVQDFVKGKLSSHENTLNEFSTNAITNISFTVDENDSSKIKLTAQNISGDTIYSNSVTTVSQAAFYHNMSVVELKTSELISEINGQNYRLVKYGQDVNVPYIYYVTDSSNKYIAGLRANLTITISNGNTSTTYSTTSVESSASGLTAQSEKQLTISKDKFKPGLNTITISNYTETNNQRSYGIDLVYYYNVVDANLELSVNTEQGGEFYTPVNYDTDNLTFTFDVTNSTGEPLQGVTVQKRIYYGDYLPNVNASYIEVLTTSKNGTLESFINDNFKENAANDAVVRLYVEARVLAQKPNVSTPVDTGISSNVAVVYIINKQKVSSYAISTLFQDIKIDSETKYLQHIQYSKYNFNFYVYSLTDQSIPITVMDNASELVSSSVNVEANKISTISYPYIFKTVTNRLFINVGNFSVTNRVNRLESNIQEPTGYTLNLDPSGKTGQDTNWTFNDYTTEFNDFNWQTNGWRSDEDGNALVLNDGANITINYSPYDLSYYTINSNTPYTVSFRYKILNGEKSTESLISCLSGNTGFDIKNNHIAFYNETKIDQNVDSSEVHEVTLVYYGTTGDYADTQAIFIDGKIQAFASASNFITNSNKIQIQANHATLYLYSVKAFRKALTYSEIQALSCFNNVNPEVISNYINQNNILASGKVSRSMLPDGAACLLLYADIADDKPWETINNYAGGEFADENKGKRHFLKAIKLVVKGDDRRNFYADEATLSPQGTSSMSYPVKNFRIYFNKKAEYSGDKNGQGITQGFYVGVPQDFTPSNNNADSYRTSAAYSLFSTAYGDSYTSAPATRFCLKADYAESSGTHNTGFARFANDIMKSSSTLSTNGITNTNESTKIPQQISVENGEWQYDVRTNIDGRPIYLFFVDSNGVETYGGRYNMNNDKANESVFGFTDVTDYFNDEKVLAEGNVLKEEAIEVDPHYSETHEKITGNVINPTECWEFSTNDGVPGDIGCFAVDPARAFGSDILWMKTWEYRFPDLDNKSAGHLAYTSGQSKPYLLYTTYQFLYNHNYSIIPSVNVLEEFAANLKNYFNVNSVVKYFVLTQWFAADDQRVKNCMLSFYCDPSITDLEASQSKLHRMRAYYIFYDNDTILGLNNAGSLIVPWNFYETDETSYSFPGNQKHAIWYNLQKCYEAYRDKTVGAGNAIYKLGELVEKAYQSLRNQATDQVISNYFETQQCKYYPDTIHNIDLELKYLGYPEHYNKEQGTREYHRKLWLKQRTRWFDNLYNAGNNSSNKIELKFSSTASSSSVNGNVKFTIDPAFRMWQFRCNLGESGNASTEVLTPNTPTGQINILNNTVSVSRETTFSGMYACKAIDFSDLTFDTLESGTQSAGSLPYLTDFIINTNSNSVKTIGNNWTNLLKVDAIPNLEKLVACKLDSTTSLNLSGFNNLQHIDLRGTNMEVSLPSSSNLQVLQLNSPNSLGLSNKTNISVLNIENTSNLTNINVENCNKLVYTTMLSTVINNINVINSQYNAQSGSNKTNLVRIVFGKSATKPYIISNNSTEEIELLNTLATKNLDGISVSGWIYYKEYVDFDGKFADLTVTSTLPTEGWNLTYSGNLREDSVSYNGSNFDSLGNLYVVQSNMPVSNWSILLNGQIADNNGFIQIVKTTSTKCWIHANPSNTNSELVSKTLNVIAQNESGDSKQTLGIAINYIPITSITLVPSSYYATNDVDVNIILNSGTTKGYLLNSDNISVNTTNKVINIVSDSGTISIDNGIINSFKFTFGANLSDANITLSYGNITANTKIYYDSVIFNRDSTDTTLTWLKKLADLTVTLHGKTDTITKSDASKIAIDSYLSDALSEISDIQDMSLLKYFKCDQGIFEIPTNVVFSTLETPIGTTQVLWSNFKETTDTNVYNVIFGENVSRINVSLNITANGIPNGMKFNLSACKEIKKIGSYPNSSTYGQGSFTFIAQASNCPNSVRNADLFDFPTSLEEFGNFATESNGNFYIPTAIFNINDGGTYVDYNSRTAFVPFSKIGLFRGNIKLGAVTSYRTIQTPFDSLGSVTVLEAAFTNNSNAPVDSNNILSIPNVTEIGPYSFYKGMSGEVKSLSTIKCNSKITKIGKYAFANSDITNFDFDTEETEVVGERAFYGCKADGEVFTFKSLSVIGSQAFYVAEGKTVTVNIYDTRPNFTSDSFGASGNGSLIINTNIRELKTQIDNLNNNKVTVIYTES